MFGRKTTQDVNRDKELLLQAMDKMIAGVLARYHLKVSVILYMQISLIR